MIITLSGLAGAGKSTLKDLLSKELGLKKYSVGDLRGKMAEERGMSIDEFNALGMTEDFTDKEADAFQEKLGKTEDNFVIDGRLSWHFIPHSIKIFLEVNPEVAAKRVFEDRKENPKRADEPVYTSPEETQKVLTERLESDRERYKKWYGIDFLERNHYDLVIDTSNLKPEETLQKVVDFVKSR